MCALIIIIIILCTDSCELPMHCCCNNFSTTCTTTLPAAGSFITVNTMCMNVTVEDCICNIENINTTTDSNCHMCDNNTILLCVSVVLGVTNLITIILCSVALCFSRRKIASLKHLRNRYSYSLKTCTDLVCNWIMDMYLYMHTCSSLHYQTETEERVVNNPAYEEQCSDLDTDGECASSRPNELSVQYSNLGPAYYESIRSVNQRVAMKGDLSGGKGGNKRPVRRTEPVNCPRMYYHEVHSDALRQWSHKVVPNDSHSYSRLYH